MANILLIKPLLCAATSLVNRAIFDIQQMTRSCNFPKAGHIILKAVIPGVSLPGCGGWGRRKTLASVPVRP